MNVVAKGIDVSQYNGAIDFNKVKANGIDFVMLRCGTSYDQVYNKDTQFDKNYKNAKAAGLLVGAYFYTYAKTVDNAKRDAKWCLQMISGKTFDYPVALDIEDNSQSKLGMTTITNMIVAFCDIIAEKYIPMVYSMDSWFGSNIDVTKITKYDVWVANWNEKVPTYYKGTYTMFQYSSVGRVSGISGNVDLDYSYKDYSKVSNNKSTTTKSANNYPYIVDENGNFIDKKYPNLFTPAFITLGRKITSNGKTITGLNGRDPRYPVYGSEVIDGETFPKLSITLPNCTSYVTARWIQLNNNTAVTKLNCDMGNANGWFKKLKELGFDDGKVPKLGAIACFDWFPNGHVAVVERIISDTKFYVAESNYKEEWNRKDEMKKDDSNFRRGVKVNAYSTDNVNLQGFIYFPYEFNDSGTADHTEEQEEQVQVWQDLYSEPIERTDATVRTVGYFNPTTFKVEQTKSDYDVAAVNYTPVLNAIYNYNNLSGASSSASSRTEPANKGYTTDNDYSENVVNIEYNTDALKGNATNKKYERQGIVNYLLNQGFNRAQVAGICGNIGVESWYRPWSVQGNLEDKPKRNKQWDTIDDTIKRAGSAGIGLFGWTYTDLVISMVAYCEQVFGTPWYDTYIGQLKFFLEVQWGNSTWKYLDYNPTDNSIKQVKTNILKCPNTLDGARQVCKIFMDGFERPSVPHFSDRIAETEFVFNHIIPYQKKSEGNIQKYTK
jgi:GH25 family lysozyme M1 (1,4-beta-N-acetylmuramidase)/surface antigen